MNKIFYFLFIFLLISNCSLDTKTGLWSKTEKLKTENKVKEKKIFEEKKVYEKEFNKQLKIKLNNNIKEKSFINNLTNNNYIINFDGSLKKISKYKFSKIDEFAIFQPELLITKKNSLIFFDDKGTILNFNQNSQLIWKNNLA